MKTPPKDHIGFAVDRKPSGQPVRVRYFTKHGAEFSISLTTEISEISEEVWNDVRGKSRQEKRMESAAFVE